MTHAIRKLSQGDHLHDPRYGVVVELAGHSTGLATMGVAWVEVDTGATSPAHWHNRTEEVYVVIEGYGTMHLDGVAFSVVADDVVSIKPGMIHSITNRGPGPLRL